MTFCEHLLKLRIAHGLSQKGIAEAIGVSTLTYQRYEYGTREPKISTLIALADYYDMSLDELVCRAPSAQRQKAADRAHPQK